MNAITVLRVYNLVDSNGNKLQLKLGRINDNVDQWFAPEDKGFRWSFKGTKIPMPVRNETWFNGFPEETMLDWLKANGWYPKTCAYMFTGEVFVFELSKAKESPDANNRHVDWRSSYKRSFEMAIKIMYKHDEFYANCIYGYAHDCNIDEASKAVKEIIGE